MRRVTQEGLWQWLPVIVEWNCAALVSYRGASFTWQGRRRRHLQSLRDGRVYLVATSPCEAPAFGSLGGFGDCTATNLM